MPLCLEGILGSSYLDPYVKLYTWKRYRGEREVMGKEGVERGGRQKRKER